MEDDSEIEEWMWVYEQEILIPGSDRICKVCTERNTVRIGSKVYLRLDEMVATVRGIHWGGKRPFARDDFFHLDVDAPGETEDGNVSTQRCHIWGRWIVIDTETLICQACGENNTERLDDILVQHWKWDPDEFHWCAGPAPIRHARFRSAPLAKSVATSIARRPGAAC